MPLKSNHDDKRITVLRQILDGAHVSPIADSDRDSYLGPRPVAHDLGTRVWVHAYYNEVERFKACGGVLVGDGITNGYDEIGTCWISLPADQCWFCDADEAETIHRCRDIDDAMLANAR